MKDTFRIDIHTRFYRPSTLVLNVFKHTHAMPKLSFFIPFEGAHGGLSRCQGDPLSKKHSRVVYLTEKHNQDAS